jgi:plastocyanin
MNNPLSQLKFRFRWLFLITAILPLVFLLIGCNGNSSSFNSELNKVAFMSMMPAEVQKTPISVKEAYQF